MASLSLISLQFDHFTIWKRDGLFKRERKKFNESLFFQCELNRIFILLIYTEVKSFQKTRNFSGSSVTLRIISSLQKPKTFISPSASWHGEFIFWFWKKFSSAAMLNGWFTAKCGQFRHLFWYHESRWMPPTFRRQYLAICWGHQSGY